LLNLDAPFVALGWQLGFAELAHVRLSVADSLVLLLTVWSIYTADRLLDTWRADAVARTLRHQFHRQHWRTFSVALIGALACAGVCCLELQGSVIRSGCSLLILLSLYFAGVHVWGEASSRLPIPKEFACGLLFAAGTVLAPWTLASSPVMLLPAVVLFAIFCSLNCVAIETWEFDRASCYGSEEKQTEPHAITTRLSRHIEVLLWATTACAALLSVWQQSLCSLALVIAGLGFVGLCRTQRRLPAELMRCAVDLPLLSPFLLFVLAL
jgi:hypothetical protein